MGKKKKRKRILIGAVAIGIILAIVVMYICTQANKKKELPEFSPLELGESYIPNVNDIVYENEYHSSGYVNNIVLVIARHSMSQEKLQTLCQNIGGTVVGRIPEINQFQIQVDARDRSQLEDLCAVLQDDDDVLCAMVDSVFSIAAEDLSIPNDPWRDTFQGITGVDWNEEKPGGQNWFLEATHVASAWDYDDAFSTIRVGVVDSGFDTEHEDLKIQVLNTEQNSPADHGTHVAGTIGATANNGIGVTGIVQNIELFGVDIHPSKEQKKANIDMISWAQAMVDCVEQGCKVINFSQGTEYTDEETTKQDAVTSARDFARIICAIISNWQDGTYSDFIIVESAGNGDDKNNGLDAETYGGFLTSMNDDVISSVIKEFESEDSLTKGQITVEDVHNHYMIVGAVDKKQKNGQYHLASFSNYGDAVTICAPGVKVFSTSVTGGFNGNYRYNTGTSMAAPIVSGIVAMTWSVDPTMSAAKVQEIIRSTATSVQPGRKEDTRNNYFMIDAKAAVEAAIEYRDQAVEDLSEAEEDSPEAEENSPESEEHSYRIFYDTLTWQEAKAACEAMGGHLVTITSEEEQKRIEDLNTQNDKLWIGASRDQDGNWIWVTGEPWSYTNWGEGEPNNSSNVVANENCVAVWPQSWNDLANDNLYEQKGYICEWDRTEEVDTVGENPYSEILDMFYNSIACHWTNCDDQGFGEVNDPDDACYMFYLYLKDASLSEIGYSLIDLDQNGQPELIVSPFNVAESGSIYDLYTIVDGQILHIGTSGERFLYSMAVDHTINFQGSGSWQNTEFVNYYLDSTDGVLRVNQAVIYDGDIDSNNPWFYATTEYFDNEKYDYISDALKPVSEEEARELQETFPENAALSLTPFDQYVPSSEEGLTVSETKEDSNDFLTAEQLEKLRKDLGVPEDLNVRYQVSPLTYWDAAECWEVYVEIIEEDEVIASVEVDPSTGEGTRSFLTYSGTAYYPSSDFLLQTASDLIGRWELDENESSGVKYIDFKNDGEVEVFYRSGESETGLYYVEGNGTVTIGNDEIKYCYRTGDDLYIGEYLDEPALLYHLQ